MYRAVLVIACAVWLLACGGGDGATTPTGGPAGAAPTTRGGTSARATAVASLDTCLKAAGLDPKPEEAIPFGVEDPVERRKVELQHGGFDESYSAQFYLFDTAAAAAKGRPAITLQREDNQRNTLVGSIVVSYGIVKEADDAVIVEGCAAQAAGVDPPTTTSRTTTTRSGTTTTTRG